ncbi:MAG: hypothetical protein KZQ86_20180, partial [Candidatus Thiodiazotropha sp. (ex Lucinoma kastoroae)]|nr:hypothetical protein [Candidatus Thiodiazotropha sp. (ex Lucinoma kastoroae)]
MTLKMTQLITHWEADEALSMIEFLDEIKDLLWRSYGEEIIRQEYADRTHHQRDEEQLSLDFDD